MKIIKKLLFILTPQERKKGFALLLMILIMALLEMIGLVSILPFIAMLSNPEMVETNSFLNKLFITSKIIGIENNQQFLFLLGSIVFILLVISLSFKALTTYFQIYFIQMNNFSIQRRMIESYLKQPYSWFLDRHSADLGKNILSEVGIVVSNGIKPFVDLIVRCAVAITIFVLLILVDPKLAITVSLTLGLAYGLIYKFSRSILIRIGKERLKANQWRFTAVSEAFGAVKEIKVGGLEKTYIERFSNPAKALAKYQASFSVINQLPRFALEAIAFGGMLLLILYLMSQSKNFINMVPILALYVFAGYRLLPSLQGIYNDISQLRFVDAGLDSVYDDLKNLNSFKSIEKKKIVLVKKSIVLKNINYQYPNVSNKVLNGINLQIKAGSTIGIVGHTGSGKTTLIDIILGLLEPQQGNLEVDDIMINKNLIRDWQSSIGYVPQDIFMADDTVSSNIAFGHNPNYIEKTFVEHAAKIANIHEFITEELPLKYNTKVGERGIRLSGGQKQRLGIARALYNNPQVLILDEATSALDNITEQTVIDNIQNQRKDRTIIMITHRLTTVKDCDQIFIIEKGKIKDKGTFEHLVKSNENFSSLFNKK